MLFLCSLNAAPPSKVWHHCYEFVRFRWRMFTKYFKFIWESFFSFVQWSSLRWLYCWSKVNTLLSLHFQSDRRTELVKLVRIKFGLTVMVLFIGLRFFNIIVHFCFLTWSTFYLWHTSVGSFNLIGTVWTKLTVWIFNSSSGGNKNMYAVQTTYPEVKNWNVVIFVTTRNR